MQILGFQSKIHIGTAFSSFLELLCGGLDVEFFGSASCKLHV